MATMIGVSTEQNTINLLPALQGEIGRVWLVETSLASRSGWSRGIEEVLRGRRIDVCSPLVLQADQDTRIDVIAGKLEDGLDAEPVVWNLGGGQKAQRLALWQTLMQEC